MAHRILPCVTVNRYEYDDICKDLNRECIEKFLSVKELPLSHFSFGIKQCINGMCYAH